jgi:imidazolonepropionase-like amidohydrolase
MPRCNALLATLLLAAIGSAKDPPLVIQGATVFDPQSRQMLGERTVVIDGERIASIGAMSAPAPEGAKVIDGRGKFLVPGLIDAHVHLVHVLDFAHVTGDEILPLFLVYGVTSLRDTGDEPTAETLVARHAAAHPELCPRVFTCSWLLDGDPPFHKDIGRGLKDAAAAKTAVADAALWHVTTLKIYVRADRALGRTVIEEGHKHGLKVTGHLSNYTAQDAAEDGIDCLEHITTVFDFIIPPDVRKVPNHRADLDLDNPNAQELIALLLKRGVVVDPTLSVFRNMLLLADLDEVYKHPDMNQVPKRLHDYWMAYPRRLNMFPATRPVRQREFKKYQELTGKLHKAGVPLLAGTDAPEPFVPPGSSLHLELELLVESGLSPGAALRSATLENARALGKEKELGSIEAGKLADMVLLDANPLDDIRNTRRIARVIKGGRVIDLAALAKAVPSH